MNIDDLYTWIEENKLRIHHWFFSTDLTFYIRGGRVSKTAGFIGTITFLCSAAGVKIGSLFGLKYKAKAEVCGGIILIVIGAKILLEGLGIL